MWRWIELVDMAALRNSNKNLNSNKATGRKIVWFLGAGASRGAGAALRVGGSGGTIKIPIQADFWDVVLRYGSKKDADKIQSFLFRYFAGYDRTPARSNRKERREVLKNIDVEEVFTFLSERIKTKQIPDSLKTYFTEIQSKLIRTVTKTLRKFEPNAQTKKTYATFSKNLLRTRDAVVSFNYDTIFEYSLPKNKPFFYQDVSKKTKFYAVFKPHGSINWKMGENKKLEVDDYVDEPELIPPTHLKFIGEQIDPIKLLWKKMEIQMQAAKTFVFIGYSFPDADFYFSSVMRSVLTKTKRNVKIILVDPDAQRLSEKFGKRFSITQNRILKYFDLSQLLQIKRKTL